MAATTITRMQVRRPDGTVEIIERDGSMGESPVWCKQAIAATKRAGRGEILSFEVVTNPAADTFEEEEDRRRGERRALVASIQGALDAQEDAFERAHAREDVLAWQIKTSHEPAVEAARAALRAFDIEHPEVLEQIRSERHERTERFLRSD